MKEASCVGAVLLPAALRQALQMALRADDGPGYLAGDGGDAQVKEAAAAASFVAAYRDAYRSQPGDESFGAFGRERRAEGRLALSGGGVMCVGNRVKAVNSTRRGSSKASRGRWKNRERSVRTMAFLRDGSLAVRESSSSGRGATPP